VILIGGCASLAAILVGASAGKLIGARVAGVVVVVVLCPDTACILEKRPLGFADARRFFSGSKVNSLMPTDGGRAGRGRAEWTSAMLGANSGCSGFSIPDVTALSSASRSLESIKNASGEAVDDSDAALKYVTEPSIGSVRLWLVGNSVACGSGGWG